MEVKPARSYRKPRYPQKSQVSRDPSLLRRVPHRWAKSAAALTALGMTLSLGACSLADAGPEARDGSQTGQSGQTETGGPAAPAGADSLAAPIFLHGGGSGLSLIHIYLNHEAGADVTWLVPPGKYSLAASFSTIL